MVFMPIAIQTKEEQIEEKNSEKYEKITNTTNNFIIKEKIKNENIPKIILEKAGWHFLLNNAQFRGPGKFSGFFKKKILKNKVFIGYFLSYSLYFFSLEGCYIGEDFCSDRKKWIKLKVWEEIISAVIMTIIIQLIFFNKISKINIIHTVIIFPLFLLYSHGYEFPDHGYFNFFYFFAMLLLFNIIFFPFDIIILLIIKNVHKIIMYIYILFLIALFSGIYVHYIVILSNCNEWEKGLNNTSIENNKIKYGCQIRHPKFCVFKIFHNIQDFTKFKKKTCNNYRLANEKENLLKYSKSPYVDESSKLIGYPLTNKCPVCGLDFLFNTDHLLRKYFMNNIVDMEKEDILEKYYENNEPEIVIDFSNNNQGDMKIKVNFNKTLSEERKLLEEKSSPYSDNLLLIFIDSISRANSLRELKKTMKFFEKFMSYKGGINKKYPEENYHSFQFFKYYAFELFTAGNWPFLFYGQSKENNNKTLFTKYFKERGYVTCNANDFCDKENTRTYHNLTYEEIYDHQLIFCDPNNDGISTLTMRCLYGKQNIEHLFEYSEQFWSKYKNNRKLSSIITNHGHEGTLNILKYIDEPLSNFLNKLFDENLLKDSTVFLYSDHGACMPSIYYLTDFFSIEYTLPMLYILINDRKNMSYEEQYMYLHENQQTFITAFDIYNTMGNILYGNDYNNVKNKTIKEDTFKSEYGISLFNKIDAKTRFPKKYAHIHQIRLNNCK